MYIGMYALFSAHTTNFLLYVKFAVCLENDAYNTRLYFAREASNKVRSMYKEYIYTGDPSCHDGIQSVYVVYCLGIWMVGGDVSGEGGLCRYELLWYLCTWVESYLATYDGTYVVID